MSDATEEFDDEGPGAALNDLAWDLVHQVLTEVDDLRVEPIEIEGGGMLIDFGVEAAGSLAAGMALAEISMSGMADVEIVPGRIGSVGWPDVFVESDTVVEACLYSQYAGWRVAVDDYFGMGSGPMRAASGREELFERLGYREEAHAVVGVLEAGELPDADVFAEIARGCRVNQAMVALAVAPTSSLAGNLQVVSRSVETAMHKLFELGFDVDRVESACGWAPLAPVAADDLTGIGRTNDAILYGGRVHLWVHGDDESLTEIGARIPSNSSPGYGEPFLKIFEKAGRDFYAIDPALFSPAEICLHNVETGRVHHYGEVNEAVLRESFGL